MRKNLVVGQTYKLSKLLAPGVSFALKYAPHENPYFSDGTTVWSIYEKKPQTQGSCSFFRNSGRTYVYCGMVNPKTGEPLQQAKISPGPRWRAATRAYLDFLAESDHEA